MKVTKRIKIIRAIANKSKYKNLERINGIDLVKLFKKWLNENKEKFICKPYFFYRKKGRKGYLYLRYENIINNIFISISKTKSIEVSIENVRDFLDFIKTKEFDDYTDLVFSFEVSLQSDKDGKYYNSFHVEPISYNSPEEVYYEEFNGCFLGWSNTVIREEIFLYLSWDKISGIKDDRLINPKTYPEVYKSYKDRIEDNDILLSISKNNSNLIQHPKLKI